MLRSFKRVFRKIPHPSYLARAVGLELVNTLLRPWGAAESPKIAIKRSKWAAVSRSAIHIPPIIVSVFLIWLNNRKYYIGPGLSDGNQYDSVYLGFYQVASKMIESIDSLSSLKSSD